MANKTTTTEERALNLLGAGVAPEQVAFACGVTASAISQLLSREDFATKVAQLRFESLEAHNTRDLSYDSLEDKLLEKLQDLLPLMYKPMEVLKALATINGAKRRGQSAPDQVTAQQTVVNIVMPTALVNRFIVNDSNQVVQAGDQQLLTMQSGTVLKQFKLDSSTLPIPLERMTHDDQYERITADGESIAISQHSEAIRSEQEARRLIAAASVRATL